jgi:hypothetical protein
MECFPILTFYESRLEFTFEVALSLFGFCIDENGLMPYNEPVKFNDAG